jgi:outer membrane lipoprotein-sorting protein
MRRIGRAARIFALAVLASGLLAARGDDTPRPSPQAVDSVDRVLEEWQRRSLTIKSVEVKFHRTDESKGSVRTRYEGRAILAAPNLALLEYSPVKDDRKAISIKDRTIWNGRSIYQFDMDAQKVWHYSLPNEWPAAPSFLRLPFFFRMTVEEAKRDFAWELLQGRPGCIFLKVAPKTESVGFPVIESHFIELDAKTFRPRWMISTLLDGSVRQTFEATDLKINTVEDTSELTDPCLDAWTVIKKNGGAWPARLFLQ